MANCLLQQNLESVTIRLAATREWPESTQGQTMIRTWIRFVILGGVATLLAFAQQAGTAGVFGTVTDMTGAAVPGAQITLTHLDRNQDRVAVTGPEGQFQFPLIPIGSYRIRAVQSGFKTFEQRDIELQVNDNRKISMVLELGELNTRVVVSAQAGTVETSSATIKNTVDGKRVLELPLNGRNVLQLGLLVPGIQDAGNSYSGTVKAAAESQRFSMNGSRQNATRFTLDGGDNMDNYNNYNMPYPFPDAVEEFSVQTANAGAEIGRAAAGAVNVVTKSGTNEIHGTGFWFVRNSELNARSYFAHQTDALKRNQAGFTLGGPLIKEKLFVFGGFQRTWIRTSPTESKTLTMPAAHRAGDFSDLLALSKPVAILDPTSGTAFAGNRIPTSRLSPAAIQLLNYSPAPGADGYNWWRQTTNEDPREYVVRADWRPATQHSLMGRYLQNSDIVAIGFDPTNINTISNSQSSYSKNATVGHTWILSPALIADTHVTAARNYGTRTNPFPKTIAELGVGVAANSNQIDVSMNGTSGLSIADGNSPARFARTNIELTHSWRWVKGMHSLVVGGDFTISRYNEYNFYLGSGQYRFNGRFSGFDQADYMLGLMSAFSQSNGEMEFRRLHYQGFYAADTYRLTRRLTLNYGVRWEPFTPMTDLNDRSMQFRPDAYANGIKSSRYVNAPAGLFFPGDAVNGESIPKAGVSAGKNQVAPRVGLAWDVRGDGRTSIRAGYGMFYDLPMLSLLNNMNVQTPFSFTVSLTDGLFDAPYQGRSSLNRFPYSGDFDRNTTFQIPAAVMVYAPQWRQPYTQSWNLTAGHTIANWVVEASYVGSKSTNLTGNYDGNAPVYNTALTLTQNQASVNARRPRQQYQSITTLFTGLNSIYNSFQFSANRHFRKDFSLQSAYTFSRAIDVFSTNNEISKQSLANPADFSMSRGPSDFDATHRLTMSFVWRLPRAGQALNQKWLGTVVDGWQLSCLYAARTGMPFSVAATNDAMASGGSPRADLVGVVQLDSGRARADKIRQFFNTSALAQPAAGSWGTLGRNALRNPDTSNADVSVTRSFRLLFSEGANLTLRGEFFSLLNHPQLGTPDVRIGRSSFGTISTVTGTRVLQLGLKVAF